MCIFVQYEQSRRTARSRGAGVSMDAQSHKVTAIGRGAGVSPPNRFERVRVEADWEQLESGARTAGRAPRADRLPAQRQPAADHQQRQSRRPLSLQHQSLSRLRARLRLLLRAAGPRDAGHERRPRLSRPASWSSTTRRHCCATSWSANSWKGEHIAISGVTDCYQPAERKFRLTRGLPRSAAGSPPRRRHHHQKRAGDARRRSCWPSWPASNLVHVFLSITTLDAELARRMEPRTAMPAARLRACASWRPPACRSA